MYQQRQNYHKKYVSYVVYMTDPCRPLSQICIQHNFFYLPSVSFALLCRRLFLLGNMVIPCPSCLTRYMNTVFIITLPFFIPFSLFFLFFSCHNFDPEMSYVTLKQIVLCQISTGRQWWHSPSSNTSHPLKGWLLCD